jgi:CO dehydrogenase maturation factor
LIYKTEPFNDDIDWGLMKIAVTGKGGTGKSTITGVMAHFLAGEGYKVLAVDADPDANLAEALGLPADLADSIVPISEQRALIKERTGANPKEFGQLFRMNPTVDDIPDRYCVEFRGIRLLVMGAVRKGGAGCACPENVLLKSLLSDIILKRREAVLVDMEAGVEHLGRASSKSIDQMLIVVEPGLRSIKTAEKIMAMGKELDILCFGIIGNKIQNREQMDWIAKQLPGRQIHGMISYHDRIRDADLSQKPLIDLMNGEIEKEFRDVYSSIKRNLC